MPDDDKISVKDIYADENQNIRFAKRQQWQTVNYVLLVYAALFAIYQTGIGPVKDHRLAIAVEALQKKYSAEVIEKILESPLTQETIRSDIRLWKKIACWAGFVVMAYGLIALLSYTTWMRKSRNRLNSMYNKDFSTDGVIIIRNSPVPIGHGLLAFLIQWFLPIILVCGYAALYWIIWLI